MSCYKPNYMYLNKNPVHPEHRFIPHDKMNDNFFENFKLLNKFEKVVPIPCGCCIGCRLDYSRNWANRAYLESLNYKHNYFITFTYKDENLPIGELGNPTLRYKDFVDFLKRLRIYYKRKFNHSHIKYMVAGEYGESTFRPHMHAIFFNLPIPDLSQDFSYVDDDGFLSVAQKSGNGVIYYYSKIINDLWSLGNILIGEATWQSMAYVSRYIVKKQKGPSSKYYDEFGIVPEFMHVSNGISKDYYLANKDIIYDLDNLNVLHNKPVNIKPPRYFDLMLKNDDPDLFKLIKNKREDSIDYITNIKLYSQSFNNLNDIKCNNKEIKANFLKRSLN